VADPLIEAQMYDSTRAWVMTEDELRRLFYGYGAVECVRIITDRATGRSRGFGFLDMPHATEATAAFAGLNGTSLGGRAVTVNEARQREERRPRGEGDGRRPRW
jgi:RNA recognition motif-containing protein